MVFLPETDLDSGIQVAERIRQGVEEHQFKQVGSITISLGVALLMASDSRESFLKRVDGKMYEAKEGGRNQVKW